MVEAAWKYLSLDDEKDDFCHLFIFLKFSSFKKNEHVLILNTESLSQWSP